MVKGYRERTMESWIVDAEGKGQRNVAPVLGGGTHQRDSRYEHLPDADPSQVIYGTPGKIRGTDQESRFGRLPDPPLKSDGSVDYDKLSETHGHKPMVGRKNISGKIG
jgi:hypothetical protein